MLWKRMKYPKGRRHVPYRAVVWLRLISRLGFRSFRASIGLLLLLWVRKIHHPEKLPRMGPALLISNHLSHFDWLLIGAVFWKPLVFVGTKELYTFPCIRWLEKLDSAVFINRDRSEVDAYNEIANRLRQRQVIVIYPEGTRSRTGVRQPVKFGFIKLAYFTKVPIVPIGMKGTFEILPPYKRFPRLRRCEVFIGNPIFVTPESPLFRDLLVPSPRPMRLSDEVCQEIGERVMDEIGIMLGSQWDGNRLRQRKRLQPTKTEAPALVRSTKTAAFFDVDHTIVKCNTQLELARFCFTRGLFPFRSFMRAALWGILAHHGFSEDTQALREDLYRTVTRHSIKDWERIFEVFYNEKIAPQIYKSAVDLIKSHRRLGHVVVLVSASIEPIVLRVMKQLRADYDISTKLEAIGNTYTGRLCKPIMKGSAKASAIADFVNQHEIDLSQSYGYSDGFSDVRWLGKVGYPRIVNPDRKLSLFSKRKGWPVTKFAR